MDYLEARFEKIFSPNSYCFWRNRNAHLALEALRANYIRQYWIVYLDIQGFFQYNWSREADAGGTNTCSGKLSVANL